MAKKARAKTASKRPERKKGVISLRVLGARFTPLLSRREYTFSRMRHDSGGPRTCTAICFPGWVRA
jgi:hypothetical protein